MRMLEKKYSCFLILFQSLIVDTKDFDSSIISWKSDKVTRRNKFTKTIVMRVCSGIRILSKWVLIWELDTIFILINKESIFMALKLSISFLTTFNFNIHKKIPLLKISNFIKAYPVIQPSGYKNKWVILILENGRIGNKAFVSNEFCVLFLT